MEELKYENILNENENENKIEDINEKTYLKFDPECNFDGPHTIKDIIYIPNSQVKQNMKDAIIKFSMPYFPEKGLLSNEQYRILIHTLKGYNVLICGSAGNGKTFLLMNIIKHLKQKNILVAVTATTGIAAQNLQCGASTLHHFIGGGLCDDDDDINIITRIKKSSSLPKWLETQTLIIDEISMIQPRLFQKINHIAQIIRECRLPFGGIQLICCGDWSQLPPINDIKNGKRKRDDQYTYCFETDEFKKYIHKIFVLQKNFRQKHDPIFYNILEELKIGKLSTDSYNKLKERINLKPILPEGIKCTKLYPLKYQVDNENKCQLEKLEGNSYEYIWKIKTSNTKESEANNAIELIKRSVPVDEKIFLKVGAMIVLLVNLDVQYGLANGLQGVVSSIDLNGTPTISFVNGLILDIKPYTWKIYVKRNNKSSPERYVSLSQLPIKLAFALTIHKSQSMSLDFVELDLGKRIFTPGQAYTGISRCKSLKGLSLIDFDPTSIMIDTKVTQFYQDHTIINNDASDNDDSVNINNDVINNVVINNNDINNDDINNDDDETDSNDYSIYNK